MKNKPLPISSVTKISAKVPVQRQRVNPIQSHDFQQAYLLQEVIECLQDGMLLLSNTGEVIHANTSAHRIFSQLNQDSSNSNFIPPVIWRLCISLLKNHSSFSEKVIILSNEIVVDKSKIFRVRARWLNLDKFQRPCLLVIIENRYESLKNIALNEAKKYQLTSRESEIWCLYRAKYTYKEIACHLYITVNTVKKHMKNIHAKRQVFLEYERED